MTKNPQQKCGQQLIKIEPRVVAADRQMVMAALDISYVTIGRYLKGAVPNLVLGLNMLQLFTKAIKDREAELDELCR
jgi:hypothetical protein